MYKLMSPYKTRFAFSRFEVAALQLAQPSLGKMAVKEPAQPFWCHIPRLAFTHRQHATAPADLVGWQRVRLQASAVA